MAGSLIEDVVLAELVQEKDRSTDSYGQGGGLAGGRKPTSQISSSSTTRPPLGGRGRGSGDVRLRTKVRNNLFKHLILPF
jgi:hypothetical protein